MNFHLPLYALRVQQNKHATELKLLVTKASESDCIVSLSGGRGVVWGSLYDSLKVYMWSLDDETKALFPLSELELKKVKTKKKVRGGLKKKSFQHLRTI